MIQLGDDWAGYKAAEDIVAQRFYVSGMQCVRPGR